MDGHQPDFDLPSGTRIGRVALRVGSLNRVLPFYQDLGFEIDRRGKTARLSATDGTDLVVLRAARDVPERRRAAAGLYHLAVRVPDRQALANTLCRIDEAGLRLTGASDHLVSEAIYLRDPEGNGIEIYRDRRREHWPRTVDGRVDIGSKSLDLDDLPTGATRSDRFPPGTDVGHVHLEVTDLDRARDFYVTVLGFRIQAPDHRNQAAFVAAGDYHHHVGLNCWNDRMEPSGDTLGLAWFELVVPDVATKEHVEARIAAEQESGTLVVADPDAIELRLIVES